MMKKWKYDLSSSHFIENVNNSKGIYEHKGKSWNIYEQTKEKKCIQVFLVRQKYRPIGQKIKMGHLLIFYED